ncbi:MAG: helix-turn-helix transcriptional regulator [Clostridia bacterium]|nr:helix-turn-helix transcriptional regulator [Clostridia bacterium]
MLPNLKAMRKKAGISQQVLADFLGVSQQSINQYENQAVEPDIYTLSAIADYFHTSIDFLVGRELTDDDPSHFISTSISQQEHLLLQKYRALKPSEQKCVDTVINTLLKKN